MAKRGKHRTPKQKAIYFWGRHAVEAALDNPDREVMKLMATREALATLDVPDGLTVQ